MNIALVIITVAALAFAGYIYLNQPGTVSPKDSPLVSTEASETPTPTPPATPTPGPSLSPSPSPPASPRPLSKKQPLSIANQTEVIPPGGSLFGIAKSHDLLVADLAKINNITNSDAVVAGSTIIIPDDVMAETITLLFVLNPVRLTAEEAKIKAGASSLYQDPIDAAKTDIKGIYALSADTPYSRTEEKDDAITLSTSDEEKLTTVTLERTESGLWRVKKVVIRRAKERE